MAYTIGFWVLWLVFLFRADSLNRKNRILGTAGAFPADARLLAPEIGIYRVTLPHFVVAEALGMVHASAVREFAQQCEHFPLDVGRRLLGGVAEINFVLDLQPPELSVEYVQFLIGGHRRSPLTV